MNWIIGVLVVVIIGFLLDREIYFYEGVHLGPRVQAWLYDRWSRKYDEGKRASQLRDDEMLAQPLLEALSTAHVPEPFILDFATGTGRLSYALTSRPEFTGHIIALDLSQGMLEQAAAKLVVSGQSARVDFLRHQALPLPFPDAAFDVVCALEVLELFPNMDEPVTELARVIRPGGILLTSRGTEVSGRKAKVKSEKEFTALLQRNGLEAIKVTKWWKLFDRAFATKHGSSPPVNQRRLVDILHCVKCNAIQWQSDSDALRCLNCGHKLALTNDNIVLN